MRIALVDDDYSVRRAVSRMLRSYGYLCSAYDSGESALADPEIQQMDCLVIDIHLSGMSGFEFFDRLTALGFPIPHFFITAHKEYGLSAWPVPAGNCIVIMKPFEESQLIALIEKSVADWP
jgi:FixJ family two-component response regulator